MTFELFEELNWAWIGIALIIFLVLLFITAPYGRHIKSGWGPLVGNRFGWIMMEISVLFVIYYFVLTGNLEQSFVNWIILSLFTFHYLNRSLIFPFRIKTKGKKMPASIVLMGITFNLASGFFIGYYLGNFRSYELAWMLTPEFIIGTIVFFTGLIINWQSDTILINLRMPGETGYKIPYGKLFKYVSSPNLLGETIEWGGFAILTWSLPGLAFFIWTVANLVPRAIANQKWYKKKFADYPAERKAILPYLL